jgi:L-aminopeptidase/D-esterase-like protein
MNGEPGRDAITDVPGIAVGCAEDWHIATGVSVILPDTRAVAAVDVRGGGTGTREVELLGADGTVDAVDAIVFSGGSAYGLSAADGVMAWLAEAGRGFPAGDLVVPIVPAAILFDLRNGGDKSAFAAGTDEGLPYRRLGRAAAAAAAAATVPEGNFGAGCGATTTGHDGRPLKGGQGTAAVAVSGGFTIGALAAVNALGATVANGEGQFYAGVHERAGEFGGLGGPAAVEVPDHPIAKQDGIAAGANTTLAVVATDAILAPAQARRVAMMAQAGLARAIRPAFSPFDGDVVFALATGRVPLADPVHDVARIGMHAADCVARAVARGVYRADGIAGWPAWREVYPTAP